MTDLDEDLAAFAPHATRRIRLHGQEYPLRAFLDLRVDEALEVVRDETVSAAPADRERATLRHVAVLVPDLPKGVCARLTPRQARRVVEAAREDERDPEKPSGLRLGLLFAQAARFYGWPWSEIRRLTLRQLQRFLALAPELRARERLEESMVAAFPHMEARGREALRQQWMGAAGYGTPEAEIPRVAWGDVRSFLGAKGNA